jgi:endoglucanase
MQVIGFGSNNTLMRKGFSILLYILIVGGQADAQEILTTNIRLNQVGFYPGGPKVAIVYTNDASEFYITPVDQKKVVFTGRLGGAVKSTFSDKKYKSANFSGLKTKGSYILVVPGVGHSYPFEIRNNVHQEVAKASIKNYYFQRLSIDLPETYAGKWARPAGHPDYRVLVHASAASTSRPEGTVISSPKGWYDAGDYNKYVVNSGITMGTMFSAFEDFPDYYTNLSLNIPESGNQLPDLIDELLWNLRWMLTMQDPEDGGVYHKLTNPNFDGMVMPHQATEVRYVVQKGTAAALNFAAVMAQAARVFRNYQTHLPGLSDSCLTASLKAWQWAQQNPKVEYNQNELNKTFDPDIVTGAYGDRNFSDEFIWAACELFVTTRDKKYLDGVDISSGEIALPSWNQVKLLGYYTLIRFEKQLSTEYRDILSPVREKLLKFADELVDGASSSAFQTVMGRTEKDYIWGSSSVAANQGIALIQAYRITGKKMYMDYALTNLDYLLGRNATGYSFVTGYGSKTPMHPHHRPSEADGITEPIPGMLSGGPNPGMQDKCNYPTSIPEEAFVDDVCSYASNEIAINWNAPLVYLTGAIEALQKKAGY